MRSRTPAPVVRSSCKNRMSLQPECTSERIQTPQLESGSPAKPGKAFQQDMSIFSVQHRPRIMHPTLSSQSYRISERKLHHVPISEHRRTGNTFDPASCYASLRGVRYTQPFVRHRCCRHLATRFFGCTGSVDDLASLASSSSSR